MADRHDNHGIHLLTSFETLYAWILENAILAGAALTIITIAITVAAIYFIRFSAQRESVNYKVAKSLQSFDTLKDIVFLGEKDRYAQLDYLVLTDKGIVLLVLFDCTGQIFAGNKMTDWTVIGEDRRYKQKNPQDHLFDQLAVVRSLNLATPVSAHIIHSDLSVFSKGTPDYVLNVNNFESQYRPASGPDMLADWEKIKNSVQHS